MRPRWSGVVSGALLYAAIAGSAGVPASEELKNVSCRVLESHTSTERGVTILIFHQSSKEDQAGLSNLPKQNEGAAVEWKSGGEKWHPATVMRLKSCFGRGLLLVPAGSVAPKEGENFLLKFPEAKTATVK